MSGQVVLLETRILPASTTNLADLNGDSDYQNDSSDAREYTTIGNLTFFTYNTEVTDKPILAYTDATTGVTTTLPDQTSFRFSPNTQISELTAYQGKLYFVATDGNASMGLGEELWSYDPNTGVFACITDYDGTNATNVNGVANTGVNAKVAVTDGTATSKNEGSAPTQLTVSNNKLYFTATNDTTGLGANRELYVYNGSSVTLLKDINPSAGFNSGSSDPEQLTNANDVYLYFTAVDSVTNGRELWRTDGTLAGTIALTDNGTPSTTAGNIRPGGQSSGVTEITPASGGVVYFSANDGTHGYELWRSDGNATGNGTTTGTFMVKDIQPVISGVNQGSNPSSLLFSNNILYFAADDGTVGKELWMSTGAKGNATLVANIAKTGPGGTLDVKQNSNPHNLTDVGGIIYFSANNGLEGFELWKYDPVTGITGMVNTTSDTGTGAHPHPGINANLTSSGDSTGSSYPGSLLNVNGTLYFVATDTYTVNGQTDFELYKVDPATGLISQVTEQNVLSNVWQSQFDIPDPQQDYTYAKSSADSFHPTEVIQDKSPTGFRTDASNEQLFLGPNGLIYFTVDDGANGSKVDSQGEYESNFEPWVFNTGAGNGWISGNTDELVQDLTVQSIVSTDPFGYTTTQVQKIDPQTGAFVVETLTFFFFTDTRLTSKNIGLAYTDSNGKTTDTGLRFDSIGTASRPNPVAFGGNSILFIANGNEVWRTNGTTDGTEVVATADVSIDLLTVSGNRYYYYGINVTYSGNTPSNNGELWSGTTGSTAAVQVLEIAPTVNGNNRSAGIRFIVPAGGDSVWFNADDFGNTNNGSRDSLWISNGTTTGSPTGTRIVVSGAAQSATNPTGPEGPNNPYAAASTPNVVYFAAGTTLYRSTIGADQAGTDLATYALSGAVGTISQITVVTGGVYFVAGGSLYFSDGTTAAGAVLVPTAGTPTNLTASGSSLYFTTNNGARLWITTATALPTVPTVTAVNAATTLSNINSLVISGTLLYFSARSAAGGQELWVSNNGAEPTQVTDIQAGAGDSLNVPTDLHSHIGIGNGLVFFGANDLALVESLNSVPVGSVSVGSTTVTSLHDIIQPTTADSNARDFIVLDVDTYGTGAQPTVYFFSDVGPMRSVLSVISTDPNDPSGTVTLTELDVFKDWNLFSYDDYIEANSQIDEPSQYYDGTEYLDTTDGNGIFKTGDTATANFGGYRGTQYLFFAGQTSEQTTGNPAYYYSNELYVLDTSNSTQNAVRVGDIRIATQTDQGNANPGYLTSIGNNADGESTFVLFAASNGPTNGSLWKVTTTVNQPGTWTPTQISSAAINPRYLQSLGGGEGTGGLIYFTAGEEGNRTAWVTDGFTATQLSTAIVDESAGDGKIFGFSNGKVYFSAREPGANSDNFELYQTDHATGATVLFAEINNTSTAGLGLAGSRPGNFTDVDGKLYFAANDGINGFELWSTDGVTVSIVQSLDSNGNIIDGLEAGAAGSNPGVVISTKTDTNLNGVSTTYFVYTYEGFAVANTRPDEFGVTNAGVNSSTQENPAKSNSGEDNGTPTLMFAATTTKYGRELWQVTPDSFFDESNPTGTATMPVAGSFQKTIDGTTFLFNPGYAQIVKDIAPGVRSSNPVNLTGVDGTVYMSADDGLSGDTLWQSIGLDQIVGNSLTVKLTDDATLMDGNSALVNGIRNPDDFTFLSTDNNTLNRLIFTAANDLGNTEVYTLNINHTPTALNLSSNSVPENQPQGTLVGNFVSTDPDTGDSFQYQFVNGDGDTDNDKFQIVGTSLQIRGVLDFETQSTYTIRVRTTDQRGQYFERVFTVNVSDVNEAPTAVFLTGATTSILENTVTTPAILIGTFGATDPDTVSGNNVFSISGADAAFFQIVIDPVLGAQLFIKPGTVLDYETKQSYTITLEVFDPSVGGAPATASFTLNVIDVNEFSIGPVSDTNAAVNSVNENSVAGTTVGLTAYAFDQDLADTVAYTLDDNAGGRFQINSVTGVVSVLNGTLLNYEATTSHSIIVRATSTDTTFSVQSFTIAVKDVDEFDVTPIVDVNNAIDSVVENAANGALVGITASASDADGTNNAMTYSLTNNAGGRFTINPTTGVVTVLNGALLDREAAASWSITVKATSADTSFSTKTFTINLTDVDEFNVGTITDTNAAVNTVMEGAANGTLVGITALAKDADATNSAITYSLTASAGGRFAINPTTGVISVANGALLDAEASASWNITVKALSTDGSSSTQAFTIAVGDTDEFDIGPVTDVNNAVNAVLENSVAGTAVGMTAKATDADASAQITYSLLNNAGGRFQIHPTTGVVTVLNAGLLDREVAASYGITVQAKSSDGSTSQASFTISITDVNEFPIGPITNKGSGVLSIPENSPVGTTVGITASAVDKDATNNQVTYSLDNSANGRFTINPTTGVVTVANSSLLDRELASQYGIIVRATSQDSSTTTAQFVITLTDVNDNPVSAIVDANAAVNSVNEKAPNGTVVGITAFAKDADVSNNTVTYSLQDTSAGRYKIDAITGVVTVADGTRIDYEAGATNIIIVKATSSDGTFKTQSFVINVNDIAETATLALTATSVAENLASGTVVGNLSVKDALPTSPVYTLVSGTGSTNNTSFQIVGNQLKTKASFNFEVKSSYSIRVQMKSSNGLTVVQVFTISVTNVNEAPTKITLSKTSVPKSSPVGTVVGTLTGTDPDAGSTLTFTLVSGSGSTDNAKFVIVGNQLRTKASLGGGKKVSIRVRVTDQFGLSFEMVISIKLSK